MRLRYIEKLWKDADKNNSGKLNVAELIGLLKGLNLKLNDNDLKKRLKVSYYIVF
jgi:Ca2+-binding EF-hand superfamily protein